MAYVANDLYIMPKAVKIRQVGTEFEATCRIGLLRKERVTSKHKDVAINRMLSRLWYDGFTVIESVTNLE